MLGVRKAPKLKDEVFLQRGSNFMSQFDELDPAPLSRRVSLKRVVLSTDRQRIVESIGILFGNLQL